MYISKVYSQHRRDQLVEFRCQDCGFSYNDGSYDDENFHNNVVPNMKCPACGIKAIESSIPYIPLKPKYPEGFQI